MKSREFNFPVNNLLQQRVVTRDRFEEAQAEVARLTRELDVYGYVRRYDAMLARALKAEAEVERLRCLLSRDAKDAKHALIRVDCRCHAWRACQAIRDRLRGEEVTP